MDKNLLDSPNMNEFELHGGKYGDVVARLVQRNGSECVFF